MSAILKKIERTWFSAKFNEIPAVFSENACTSLQITFLTKPTGIYLIMTYNRHIPDKKMMSFFLKKSPYIKNYPLFESKPAVLRLCFIVGITDIVWMMGRYRYRGRVDLGKLPVGTPASPSSDHYNSICRLGNGK